ncbi:MAG: TIGR03663 family protein [Chloroflexi bacterium]|nr:TIGR03663 family protein [Chloroflexota bacterium]
MIGARITVEQAAYLAIFLASLWLRLWNLGTMPLQSSEAASAFQSWLISQGSPGSLDHSALLVHGNAFLFFLFGASDSVPRVLPALAGALLVVLPYLLRAYLGSLGALAAAVFFALSPTTMFFSRSVDSGILIATITLCLVGLVLRFVETRQPIYAYLSAATLGLLVNTGVAAYLNVVLALAFAIGVIVWARFAPNLALPGLRSPDHLGRDESWPEGLDGARLAAMRSVLGNAALAFIGTTIVVATGAFTNLHGVQESLVSQLSLRTWLDPSFAQAPLAFYVQLMLVYETAVVVFAAAYLLFILYSGRRRGLVFWFLAWWAIAATVVLSLVPQKSAVLLLQPLVPATLLAGEFAGGLITWVHRVRPFKQLAAASIITLPPLLLLMFVLSRFSLPGEKLPMPFALAPSIMIVFAVAGFARWLGSLETVRLYGVLALVLLLAGSLHTASNLSYQSTLNPGESIVTAATVSDVRTLAGDVDEALATADVASRKRGILVDPAFKDLLAWYLRGRAVVVFAETAASRPPVIIGRGDTSLPSGDYAFQRYTISARWMPRTLDFGRRWRWLVFREPTDPVTYEVATVYLAL